METIKNDRRTILQALDHRTRTVCVAGITYLWNIYSANLNLGGVLIVAVGGLSLCFDLDRWDFRDAVQAQLQNWHVVVGFFGYIYAAFR